MATDGRLSKGRLPTLVKTLAALANASGKLKNDGAGNLSWDAAGSGVGVVRYQVFTASGTYVPDPNLLFADVMALGGGPGGGGAANPTGTNSSVGGGGTAGCEVWKRLLPADIGASKPVTIGAAGASETAGGDTSLGTLVVAKGGKPGTGNAGQVGVASTTGCVGDRIFPGATGTPGLGLPGVGALGGTGGSSRFGSGGTGSPNRGNGNPASGYGSSGGGAAQQGNNAGNLSGGLGSPGLLIVTEYCSQ